MQGMQDNKRNYTSFDEYPVQRADFFARKSMLHKAMFKCLPQLKQGTVSLKKSTRC